MRENVNNFFTLYNFYYSLNAKIVIIPNFAS